MTENHTPKKWWLWVPLLNYWLTGLFPYPSPGLANPGFFRWQSTVDTLCFCCQAARVQISAVSIWLAYITSWKSCNLSVICRKGDDGKKTTQQSWYKDSLDSLVNYHSSEFAEQAAWLIPGPCDLAHQLASIPPGCFSSTASLAPLGAPCKARRRSMGTITTLAG